MPLQVCRWTRIRNIGTRYLIFAIFRKTRTTLLRYSVMTNNVFHRNCQGENFSHHFIHRTYFCGCSITPRYHSFGFNLEWKSRNTPRAKSTTSPILAESQLQFAPLHNEIRETKQELHPTAEISHQPVNKYLSVNCEHRAIHSNTQQKPNLQPARTQGSTVSAKRPTPRHPKLANQ